MKQRTSPTGVTSLCEMEGCKLVAYRDTSLKRIWTIGVGHTGPGVTEGLTITQERAEQLLAADLLTFEDVVSRAVCVPLTQGQFDACVSFCYNTGPGAADIKDGFVWLKARDGQGQPQHSTLLKKLNRGDYAGASEEFLKWALPRRRAAERALFLGEIN
jgi:lysozyme